MLKILFGVLLGYFLGSISSAILVCRLFGLPDPRVSGSHNPGTTNVLRIGGKLPALLTLLGDVLKGMLPVYATIIFSSAPINSALAMLAAFLGHLYPIYFQFRGGKGVATAFGGLIALSPITGGVLALLWLIIAVIFRFASLAAIITAIIAPFLIVAITHQYIYFGAVLCMSIFLIAKHKQNIRNLVLGIERKIGQKN